MKIVFVACLVAVAVASPQRFGRQRFVQVAPRPRPDYRPIAILRDERQDYGDGNFAFDFETENGIVVNADGARGYGGQSNVQGSYSFPLPDGSYNEVRYFADENGFRAESPFIPTPHPLPAHAIEQIRKAEEERRRGIVWD